MTLSKGKMNGQPCVDRTFDQHQRKTIIGSKQPVTNQLIGWQAIVNFQSLKFGEYTNKCSWR